MKILQTSLKYCANLGIYSSHQLNQKLPFNKRVVVGFLLFECTLISECVYIFHVADGFMDRMMGISLFYGTFTIFICFASIVFRQALFFESFEKCENLIDASEALFSMNF